MTKKTKTEQTPKTLECCGNKPNRIAIQLGFRDEINRYVLKCRKCERIVIENDDSNGDYDIELKAVKKWNEIVLEWRRIHADFIEILD